MDGGVFILVLILAMGLALASGFPVAYALPGSAVLSIGLAALCGHLFAGSVDAYFVNGGPSQWLASGVTNFRGVYWAVQRDTLIAIPLFVFMGIMLEKSKVAEDLLVTMAQLFGPIPGGLGIAVVFVGALLAATTGIVGATVVAMGLISLPVMLRSNYSTPLATGTICASGTLGQIIPPSIVLIILADQLSSATDHASTLRLQEFKHATGLFSMPSAFDLSSTSAGDMFLGALVPGLILVGLYIVYIVIVAVIRPRSAPPVKFEGRIDLAFLMRVVLALVPPLTLIFTVLGSIIMGVATVNQAGAIGAIGALIMAGYRLRDGEKRAYYPAILAIVSVVAIFTVLGFYTINVKSAHTTSQWTGVALAGVAVVGLLVAIVWSLVRVHRIGNTLRTVMIDTAKTSSLVFIILMGAAMLTAAFRSFGGEEIVKDFLSNLPGGFVAKFVVVMSVIFVLGFFLDFIEIAVVVVPIVSPILLADPTANVTAVWLGVMIGVNMQTSFLTPPFGFALFYLRGVAPPSVKTIQIYAGVVPFILLQLAGLTIVGVWPSLVNYLPDRVFLTSETAPPPKNPRLQYCLEDYLFRQYAENGDDLRKAIAAAKALDISYLPQELRSDLSGAFEAAGNTFDRVAKVKQATAALEAFTPRYRPVHREARRIQGRIRDVQDQIKDADDEIRDLGRSSGNREAEIAAVRQRIADLKAEVARLQKTIPPQWNEMNKDFKALDLGEKRTRLQYRRTVDNAYQTVATTLKLVEDAGKLAAIGDRLAALPDAVASEPPKQAAEKIREAERLFTDIQGSSRLRSKFSAARRDLTRSDPDKDKATKALAAALDSYRAEVAWRQRAAKELKPGLARYEEQIRDTIGLRSQPRLNGEQADDIASCLSVPRDISLYF